MSAQIIQCDYDKLAEIVNVFGREADETCRLLQTVQQCVSALQSGGWIGRGAEVFFAEMSELVFPGISRLGNALGDAGSVTRRVANLLRNAEEEASRVFQGGGEAAGLGTRNLDTMPTSSLGTPKPISLTRDQETLMSTVANALRSGDQETATKHWADLIRSLSTGAGGIGESEVTSLVWQTLAQAGQRGDIIQPTNPLERDIQAFEDKLNSVGDDAQLANIDLQNALQKQQQVLQMMSNTPKMLFDTALAVVRKIGG